MTISKYIVIPILTGLLMLMDWYVGLAIKTVFRSTSIQTRGLIKHLYWSTNVLVLIGLWAYNFLEPEILGRNVRTVILSALFVLYGSKSISIVIILAGDLFVLLKRSTAEVLSPTDFSGSGVPITRSEFLMKAALMTSAVPAIALTWGIVSGAHDYRKRLVRLVIKNLPRAFEGMTIAQISDIHSGSFFNKVAVEGGVGMLMDQKPDMVFFTGDLVNDRAGEVTEYLGLFNKIKAPLGVYSTLGNHDYGAYKSWPNVQAKNRNLEDLKHAHRLLGYDLLLDQNRIITLDGEKLALVGVQNISGSEPGFPNNGNLSRALEGTDEASVKLLLSHDPTHWDMEVNHQFPGIDVMFSGHTHGLQFGVTIGGKTYSPAQWQYKQWAGLYQKNGQQLYVNRGFGYLGYPGRVAMPPEITLFELSAT